MRLKKISGPNLARNWVMIPHVTNFEEADVTEEAFRVAVNTDAGKTGMKVTIVTLAVRTSDEGRRWPKLREWLSSTVPLLSSR